MFKSTFLCLAATAYASPISTRGGGGGDSGIESRSLEARAQYKDVDCNGKVFTADVLKSSIAKSKEIQGLVNQGKKGYGYPKVYNNNDGKHFPGAGTQYEYPLSTPVYSGSKSPLFNTRRPSIDLTATGDGPELYRVIMTKNHGYKGALNYVGDVGYAFEKCINVEDKKKQEEEEARKKKEASEKQSKEAKEKQRNGKDGKTGKH